MRVTIQFRGGLTPALEVWRQSLAPDPGIAERMAEALIDSPEQRLIASSGRPVGAYLDSLPDPPEYWCELSGGTWVVYTATERRLLFSRWLEVVVIALAPRPPKRAAPVTPSP